MRPFGWQHSVTSTLRACASRAASSAPCVHHLVDPFSHPMWQMLVSFPFYRQARHREVQERHVLRSQSPEWQGSGKCPRPVLGCATVASRGLASVNTSFEAGNRARGSLPLKRDVRAGPWHPNWHLGRGQWRRAPQPWAVGRPVWTTERGTENPEAFFSSFFSLRVHLAWSVTRCQPVSL